MSKFSNTLIFIVSFFFFFPMFVESVSELKIGHHKHFTRTTCLPYNTTACRNEPLVYKFMTTDAFDYDDVATTVELTVKYQSVQCFKMNGFMPTDIPCSPQEWPDNQGALEWKIKHSDDGHGSSKYSHLVLANRTKTHRMSVWTYSWYSTVLYNPILKNNTYVVWSGQTSADWDIWNEAAIITVSVIVGLTVLTCITLLLCYCCRKSSFEIKECLQCRCCRASNHYEQIY